MPRPERPLGGPSGAGAPPEARSAPRAAAGSSGAGRSVRLIEPEGEVRLSLAAIGDVAAIGRVRERARAAGYDAVLAAAAAPLAAADLGFANLEMPIAEPGWVQPGCAPESWQEEEIAAALARAGVRTVSLANNHVLDAGPAGLARTRDACRAAGLLPIGAGADLDEASAPARLEVRGVRVVALAFAEAGRDAAAAGRPGVAPLDPDSVRAALERHRAEADLLVVSVHWGSMYVDVPPPRVLALADTLSRLADVTLGHHPHVLQGYRRSGRSLSLLSLGDACFDPRSGEVHATVAAERRRESGVFTVRWADRPGLDLDPLRLDEDGVPEVPGPAAAAAQAERLRALAAGLADAAAEFRERAAPTLVRYELESLATYLRQGRFGRALRLIGALRPRHLPVLWNGLLRLGRRA